MKTYVGLIGDVINSKKINIEDRLSFQKNLKADLERLNNRYKDKIVAKLTLTLGDEFQGLFSDAFAAFEVLTFLQAKHLPKIRFGIGIGSLYTDIDNERAIGADGPVWWNARNALLAIKKTKDKKTNIAIRGFKDELIEELVNNALVFVYAVSKKWNKSQKPVLEKLISTYGLSIGFKQINFARNNNLDPSKVSRVIKNTMIFDYVEITNCISNLINKEGKLNG
ncbi:MAG: SatD family protein [Bacilli bacterium]|nr:SatD family protein [Bacilli bacterium]